MISKELLSEVLGIKLFWRDIKIVDNIVHYPHMNGIYNEVKTINIYELAHKCKEWAYDKERYFLSTGKDVEGWFCLDRCNSKSWLANTEPEAIFKACEWIMEQKAKA